MFVTCTGVKNSFAMPAKKRRNAAGARTETANVRTQTADYPFLLNDCAFFKY